MCGSGDPTHPMFSPRSQTFFQFEYEIVWSDAFLNMQDNIKNFVYETIM